MSSFSRGFVRGSLVRGTLVFSPSAACCRCSPLQPQFLSHTRIVASFRPFHSSFRLGLAKPNPRRLTPSVAVPYAARLAAQKDATVLYEAPSHFWFRFSSFNYGSFCIAYAVVNYWTIFLYPPAEMSWWHAPAFGIICSFMVGIGGYFILGASRVIRSVRAVPAAQAAAMGGKSVARRAATTPLFLEVSVEGALPFLPARRVWAAPADVTLPWPLHLFGQVDTLHGQELAKRKLAEIEGRRLQRQYDMNHLMTAPFRHARRALTRLFQGTRRAFVREGFAKVEVKGTTYKLDVLGAWALEHGRALDRLVNIKDRNPPPAGS